MAQVTCPHCGVLNANAGSFCESCGKALPAVFTSGPRVVSGTAIAGTAVGQRLQSGELQKSARRSAGALLAVAILQMLAGFLIMNLLPKNFEQKTLVLGMLFGIGVVFFGLAGWALKQPLPAAIVGLALYITLWLVDIVADPTAIARGILLKLIIIAVLVRAIQAGLQHRKLMQEASY